MYLLQNGNEVTAAQIKAAFELGEAVIIHGHADGRTSSSLALDGEHYDTRGQCHSVWDEVWTRTPSNYADALAAARVG